MTKPLFTGSEWNFQLLGDILKHCEEIGREELALDLYPNQIEVITSEQMLDVYSTSLPVSYRHWSHGKAFVREEHNYRKGFSGLAYEVVFNSLPCISFLLEENSATMQALTLSHAACGHNNFFKTNELFREWTDASSILDYLIFARDYINECEQKYGVDAVEAVLDSCHALQYYGVDKYKRPSKPSKADEERRRQERSEEERLSTNALWDRVVPKKKDEEEYEMMEPQENLLYFLEKNAPNLQTWQREVIRIVRKIAQYFYPQRQTQVMNEGWACVSKDTLIATEDGLLTAEELVESKFAGNVESGHKVVNWFVNENRKRIKLITNRGYEIHGGDTHKLFVDGEWKPLNSFKVGDKIPLVVGNENSFGKEYVEHGYKPREPRMSMKAFVRSRGVSPSSVSKVRCKDPALSVSPEFRAKCEKVIAEWEEYQSSNDLVISDMRQEINIPPFVDEEMAEWLGMHIGDGGIYKYEGKSASFAFTKQDPELLDLYQKTINKYLGREAHKAADRNHFDITFHSNPMFDFMVGTLGMAYGNAAPVKTVPDVILKSPKSVVAAFLRGHFSTDGCVTKDGDIILLSASEKLLKVEQQILLNFGIVTTLKKQNADGIWRLSTTSNQNKRLFLKHIGFSTSLKQNRLVSAVENIQFEVANNDAQHLEVVEIEHDEGTTYDFTVDQVHRYRVGPFVNHNCTVHYHIMTRLHEKGLLTDGSYMEFLTSHTAVVAQRPMTRQFNPYHLGFNIFADIKRICTEPTKEDEQWFPELANTNWLEAWHFAKNNFRDESFITQYLSPKMIRGHHMFLLDDDSDSDMYDISRIHNDRGYREIRETLSDSKRLTNYFADIQIVDVDFTGDRTMFLEHKVYNGIKLDEKTALQTVKHVKNLWGYPVELVSLDAKSGSIVDMFGSEEDDEII